MTHINTITLRNVLPAVFADNAPAPSDVWHATLTLNRPHYYQIEAPSGTGKTSLCAFLYGLRTDYLGEILFNDTPASSLDIDRWCRLRREHLAFLPQDLGLFPELTARENILVKNRLTDRYTAVEIDRMLDALGIGNRADWPVGRLSVGQQQRVAIIRAIAQPFDFILLDEPVSHLDAANNAAAAALITAAARANDAAIVSTSVGNPLQFPADTLRLG